MSCYYSNTKTQVELILTTEDLLRSIGRHRRFITGRKKIQPNFKSTTKAELATEMEDYNTCEKVIVRFIVWIYFGFKEFSYQLWGGQRYDTLEIIQETLNSNLVRYIGLLLPWRLVLILVVTHINICTHKATTIPPYTFNLKKPHELNHDCPTHKYIRNNDELPGVRSLPSDTKPSESVHAEESKVQQYHFRQTSY